MYPPHPLQIHESLRDEDLLAACRQHGGEVVAWRFLRGSHCAFVDFATQVGAGERGEKGRIARFKCWEQVSAGKGGYTRYR